MTIDPDAFAATRSPPPPPSGWPPYCTLAELSRILTLVYGVRAPTESSLKKWSAAGVFRPCIATEEDHQRSASHPPTAAHALLQRPRRAGRPGLTLRTHEAIALVHEIWPFLADSDSHAVVELVVARTADHLRSALDHAKSVKVSTPLGTPSIADSAPSVPGPGPGLQAIERQLEALAHEMGGLKREVAQFSALRNNLITRLDEAVVLAKESLAAGTSSARGVDPLVEARRDRDMGLMKSTLSEILDALRRIELERAAPSPSHGQQTLDRPRG
ncbi:hypothetical protein [Variovorax sp. KK3]|uniref:hypothetical protein n=1 Tax=Variovorax sp. KK3 TaxID=1855728 RepID=UPI00117E7122|nr:hypothetical protein [Variovorax sp. KK3]